MLDETISEDGTLNSKLLDELYYETLDLSSFVVEYFQKNNKENYQILNDGLMVFYTSECNRITTGIMQAMSWCLMQKGVRSGEITAQEAGAEESRLSDSSLFDEPIGCDTEKFPSEFLEYSERTRKVYKRIVRLDRLLYELEAGKNNPVHGLMNKIEEL